MNTYVYVYRNKYSPKLNHLQFLSPHNGEC